jgi:hypothetical protein
LPSRRKLIDSSYTGPGVLASPRIGLVNVRGRLSRSAWYAARLTFLWIPVELSSRIIAAL